MPAADSINEKLATLKGLLGNTEANNGILPIDSRNKLSGAKEELLHNIYEEHNDTIQKIIKNIIDSIDQRQNADKSEYEKSFHNSEYEKLFQNKKLMTIGEITKFRRQAKDSALAQEAEILEFLIDSYDKLEDAIKLLKKANINQQASPSVGGMVVGAALTAASGQDAFSPSGVKDTFTPAKKAAIQIITDMIQGLDPHAQAVRQLRKILDEVPINEIVSVDNKNKIDAAKENLIALFPNNNESIEGGLKGFTDAKPTTRLQKFVNGIRGFAQNYGLLGMAVLAVGAATAISLFLIPITAPGAIVVTIGLGVVASLGYVVGAVGVVGLVNNISRHISDSEPRNIEKNKIFNNFDSMLEEKRKEKQELSTPNSGNPVFDLLARHFLPTKNTNNSPAAEQPPVCHLMSPNHQHVKTVTHNLITTNLLQ